MTKMSGHNYLQDMEIFTLLISGLAHDVCHDGHNNIFHINSKSEIAMLYNDISVLEN